MSGEPQLYRINPENRESEKIQEVEFSQLGLQERRDIQEWVAANPGILGDDLLIIGKEFSGFDRTNERLDLLAVDRDGKLVIIELKRDDTGADAHWQAIKYASYFRRATTDEIVMMAADYLGESQEETATRLMQHLDADDLNDLNNHQRIILASHRFAPEVTTAAVWLNEQVLSDNIITCVKLTPYQDTQSGTLYVQASAIIPVPGIDDYLVGVGPSTQVESVRTSSFGTKLAATFSRNRNDEVSRFLRKTGQLVMDGLAVEVKPDKRSRWGGLGGDDHRYYHFWYNRPPWSNWGVSYRIELNPQEDPSHWQADMVFMGWNGIDDLLVGVTIHPEQIIRSDRVVVRMGVDTLNDDFAASIAGVTRSLIEQITPRVDDFGNESGSGDDT